jgi:hypothetical protein
MNVNDECDGSKQGKVTPASMDNYQVQKEMDFVSPAIGPCQLEKCMVDYG